ncbi:agmatine deiminase [Pseudohalioglobus sediminis]|uniref:Putative agmatine deiminase n=1 Tax=Pseudohalioglobus sediminis TaxID=2606449 RepID=A0A5B0WVW3_9GAMM|nr:agmatine deiminase [Pseudohalioglobus sediminis]KAA1190505.1 agmatine deiminase [Pseudohalioglobus sediminis]
MSSSLPGTPRADGFRMPGEHEPQQAVLMAWPERADNWREAAGPAQRAFAAVAAAIAAATPVIMCISAAQRESARALLPAGVTLLEIPCNDSWMRDIGPTYVVNSQGEKRGIDWGFNAWGGEVNGLYPDWSLDAAMAASVLAARGEGRYRAPLVLEGGSIHVDGQGTCITTAECLLHPGRNPQLDQSAIGALLKDYLNVDKIIWLPRGLHNDETDGHVDNILHIAGPGEVLLTWCDDPVDPVFEICRECLAALELETDARGRRFTVHKLPMPGPLLLQPEEAAGIAPSGGMSRMAGERLAGSYANFLITNQRVVFPLLDPRHDDDARDILQAVFPQHQVVGVPGREILLGGGNIHCITQQIPL